MFYGNVSNLNRTWEWVPVDAIETKAIVVVTVSHVFKNQIGVRG